MPIAKLSRAVIHYRLEGPARAPVVLLSNSLGTDLNMWDAQVAALRSDFRVLRYDVRGHGGSSGPAGPYSLADLGGDVLGLLDALGISAMHACGVSLGGLVSLWLALHAPDRVRSLMPCNTAARIGTTGGWNDRIAQVSTHGMDSIADATMQRWFTDGFRLRNPELVEHTRRQLTATFPAGYAACCVALRDADVTADLGRIACPVLVVSGTHDPVTPPSDGHVLQRSIPRARYRELSSAHLSNIEAADEFSQAMLSFVTEAKEECDGLRKCNRMPAQSDR